MELETQGNESMERNNSPTAPCVTRRGKKRSFHRIPPMPQPVKALWESADAASQQTAHGLCTAILETWVGKASRAEVAERLRGAGATIRQVEPLTLEDAALALLGNAIVSRIVSRIETRLHQREAETACSG